jgi:hypothetical protein
MNEKKFSDWYQKKVDRITRVEGVTIEKLAGKSVSLVIDENNLHRYSNQAMVIIVITLLSRWCNKIHVIISADQPSIVPGFEAKTMKEVIEEIISINDDEISFSFHESLEKATDAYLAVGNPDIQNRTNLVWIEADGWIAGYGRNIGSYKTITKTNVLNPVGPVMAACLAHAVIFKLLLDIPEEEEFGKWFSLYDLSMSRETPDHLVNPELPKNIDLGKIFQVGCGAVGSSFDFILSLTNCTGQFTLVDYDIIKAENLASSLLFQKSDAITSAKKIDACFNMLSKSRIKPFTFGGDYSSFIKSIDYFENYPDAILCFANEQNVWSTIQNNYPPTVLHATTTPNWGINYGRHIPLLEWCIVCRFGVRHIEIKTVCATSVIKITEAEEQTFGVLPFLSPAAAALTMAQLFRLNMGVPKTDANFVQLFMKSTAHQKFIQQQRSKVEDCSVCTNQYKDVYEGFLRKSKYN